MNRTTLLSNATFAESEAKQLEFSATSLKSAPQVESVGVVPRAGLQPATPCLEGTCSDATELPGHARIIEQFPHVDLVCYGPNGSIHLVKIDTSDLPQVLAVSSKWRVANFYPRGHRLYAYCRVPRPGKPHKTVYLHRVVTGAPDGLEVDHRYHRSLDNRRASLRVVPHSENQKNRIDSKERA